MKSGEEPDDVASGTVIDVMEYTRYLNLIVNSKGKFKQRIH